MPSRLAVRDQILPVPAGGSIFDLLRDLQVDAIECLVDPMGYLPYLRTGDEGAVCSTRDGAAIEATQGRLARERVRIVALLISTDFSGDHADQHVDWAVATVHAAAALGAPVVRIDPWTVKRDLHVSAVRDNFITRTRRVLEQTADTGVDLGMENHGPLFNDPDLIDAVLGAIPDKRFGLTLDTGNFYWWGLPASQVYALIARYAPRTKHTHIKNICYPAEIVEQRREIGFEYKRYCSPLDSGNLDLHRIVELLRAGGYQGDLCIEDESLAHAPESKRLEILKQDVDALRRAAGE